MVLCKGETITVQDLPEDILSKLKPENENFAITIPEQGVDLGKVEQELILQALVKKNWNQTQASKLLNISRNSLIYSMKKYGIAKTPPEESKPIIKRNSSLKS